MVSQLCYTTKIIILDPKIYTRGNGQIGSDASALSKYMKFPKINTSIYIRGELLISKSNMELL